MLKACKLGCRARENGVDYILGRGRTMARSGSDRSGSDKAANRIKNYGGETMDGCDSTSRAIRGGRHMDIRTQFGYSLILFMTI